MRAMLLLNTCMYMLKLLQKHNVRTLHARTMTVACLLAQTDQRAEIGQRYRTTLWRLQHHPGLQKTAAQHQACQQRRCSKRG